ncbi:head decoration protein [Nitratireductor aquimarinus]|uniref:Head decoration protein n=1 Tax=Nitratireductor aquimarinus TaxID=889300 RepID=A0ABU4AJA3_9HYPH|nr:MULTISPECIES: head decoration protein [Nitratireductor]MDV6226295.1 head decoration protein [Nitratireductor aquimarinus]
MNTATFAPNDLLVSDIPVVTRNITLTGGAYERGTVLGRITASDKYTISEAGAADGSEVPALVLAFDADASGGDVDAAAYASAGLDASKLTFGAGHDADSVEAAFRAADASLFVRKLA